METYSTDTVVIGAGVAGLAVARQLAGRGREVMVLEAEGRFGEGISSRNSEVIHAGIYYPENSLKARLCVSGREALYAYCREHRIAHRKTGKWILATDDGQLQRLDGIRLQALRNGVTPQAVSQAELGHRLPQVKAVGALFSPETGIIDSHGFMMALVAELEAGGGQVVYQAPVEDVVSGDRGHRLSVGGDYPCQLVARTVINSAGLDAVPLARRWQGYAREHCPELHFARGVYFTYGGKHPFDTLIYPVPEPGGLGVHLTLDLAGQARFGPDVEWIQEKDFTVDPERVRLFHNSIRRWWPRVDAARLQPAYAGIRPKLSGPGEGDTDFLIQGPGIHGVPGLVHLFGIESPGLTSALALAWEVDAILD